jgi:hypothetical protein
VSTHDRCIVLPKSVIPTERPRREWRDLLSLYAHTTLVGA